MKGARSRLSLPISLLAGLGLLLGCSDAECTEAGCESTIVVDYGGVVINEPYTLSINPGGQTTAVTCLALGPDAEPLPEGLECDANGFELSGDFADQTTLTVAVVIESSDEVVVANALVPLTVAEVIQPNGPECDPACYRRVGSTAGL